jgi:hypothetical protein
VDGDSGFLVEDFLEAIAAQLDRTQDALRLKAAVRPLTYALKDLQIELKVFVSMDGNGDVRFRGAGPNEDGASTVQLGFTTITRPMIEENTVSLAVSKTPTLEEMGLDPRDRQRLERLGVRNAGQLQELGDATGASGAARVSGIPVDVLRAALHRVRPTVHRVGVPMTAAPVSPVAMAPTTHLPPELVTPQFPEHDSPQFRGHDSLRMPARGLPATIDLPRGARTLVLHGANLSTGPVAADLDGQPLDVDATPDRIVVTLPHDHGGSLSVALDGEGLTSTLRATTDDATAPGHLDPWQPAATTNGWTT